MTTEKILANLAAIEEWIDEAPDPSTFQNDNDFMSFVVELMNRCLYLLKIGVSLVPTEDAIGKGHTKQTIIIVGHMVRIVKLYEGFLMHVAKRQLELASIFMRLIYETNARMDYLIKSKTKRKTIRSFILASYKSEKEVLEDLRGKQNNRPLINIESRIKKQIEKLLRQDGISDDELASNRIWNVDGKDFRRILSDLDKGLAYSYIFGAGSHYVHGDWHEIRYHHIKKEGRYYLPKLDFSDPDPRIACPVTLVCLDTLILYLKWNKSDPHKVFTTLTSKLTRLCEAVDSAHEKTLGS
jgi:Family of unknown function (DUF5677)